MASSETTQSITSTAALQGSTKEHIKFLSRQLVNSLNTRTFREVAGKLLVPNFSGYHDMDDSTWVASERDALIPEMEQYLADNPSFHTEIQDMSVELDEGCSNASVWIRRTDMGIVETPRKETVMEFTWVKKGKEWFCTGYQGVRSFPFYGGE